LHDDKRKEVKEIEDNHISWHLGLNEVIHLAEKMDHHIDGNKCGQAQEEEFEKFFIQVF
jgi:tyrosyl-tRNA synthetase